MAQNRIGITITGETIPEFEQNFDHIAQRFGYVKAGEQDEPAAQSAPVEGQPPVKRGPGRPRKNPEQAPAPAAEAPAPAPSAPPAAPAPATAPAPAPAFTPTPVSEAGQTSAEQFPLDADPVQTTKTLLGAGTVGPGDLQSILSDMGVARVSQIPQPQHAAYIGKINALLAGKAGNALV